MGLVLDMVIALSALLAAAYCLLLSRRLRAFTRLDGEVGKAIAVLSQQVDALTIALQAAEQSNTRADSELEKQIARADATARKLELLMAAQQKTPSAESVPCDAPDRVRGSEQFAPFTRSAVHGSDSRPRILRKRDPIGLQR